MMMGWSTLSKDEWNYLLNERENAATLKSIATVAGVKGLVLLPDAWKAPEGAPALSGDAVTITADDWALLETGGAVFLPAAGQLTSTYVNNQTTTTVTEAGTYWTSTPSDDESGWKAIALTIGDTDVSLDTELNRRVATAVRLVKAVTTVPLANDWVAEIADMDCTDEELKPTVTVKNGETVLTEGVDYTVTYENNVEVGTATVTVTGIESAGYVGSATATFEIVRDMSNVFSSTGEYSWASYVAKEDLTTPEGLTAYVVSQVGTTTATATPVGYIPAGTGVLLRRSNATNHVYKGSAYLGDEAVPTTLLVGDATNPSAVTAYKDYVLYNDELVLSSGASVAAGRAYLPAPTTSNAASRLFISIDGEETGIDGLEVAGDGSQSKGWYDLSGRQLKGKPNQKGVYLYNGKKRVVK